MLVSNKITGTTGRSYDSKPRTFKASENRGKLKETIKKEKNDDLFFLFLPLTPNRGSAKVCRSDWAPVPTPPTTAKQQETVFIHRAVLEHSTPERSS